MRFEYDARLIEEAVFRELLRRASDGEGAVYKRYRREIDELYDIQNDEGQGDLEEALRLLNSRYFTRLGFWLLIRDMAAEFPHLERAVTLTSILPAERRTAEGAELFVREGEDGEEPIVRTLVLRIYPESFLDLTKLRGFLERELYHISDMLDPIFGYKPELGQPCFTAAQENLVRDHYSVLWNIYIEGRIYRKKLNLHDQGHASDLQDVSPRLQLLARSAFAGISQDELNRRLKRIWDGDDVTHAELVRLSNPFDVQGEQSTTEKGMPCPRCGFPTWDWVDGPHGPSCRQCADMLNAAHAAASRLSR